MQISHSLTIMYYGSDMKLVEKLTDEEFAEKYQSSFERFGIPLEASGDMVTCLVRYCRLSEIDGQLICADRLKENQIRVVSGTRVGCINGYIYHTVPIEKRK